MPGGSVSSAGNIKIIIPGSIANVDLLRCFEHTMIVYGVHEVIDVWNAAGMCVMAGKRSSCLVTDD